jgi:hypothetical protein
MKTEYIKGLYTFYKERAKQKGDIIFIHLEYFEKSELYLHYKPQYDLYLRKQIIKKLRNG